VNELEKLKKKMDDAKVSWEASARSPNYAAWDAYEKAKKEEYEELKEKMDDAKASWRVFWVAYNTARLAYKKAKEEYRKAKKKKMSEDYVARDYAAYYKAKREYKKALDKNENSSS